MGRFKGEGMVSALGVIAVSAASSGALLGVSAAPGGSGGEVGAKVATPAANCERNFDEGSDR
jgi:hypothetical protein